MYGFWRPDEAGPATSPPSGRHMRWSLESLANWHLFFISSFNRSVISFSVPSETEFSGSFFCLDILKNDIYVERELIGSIYNNMEIA